MPSRSNTTSAPPRSTSAASALVARTTSQRAASVSAVLAADSPHATALNHKALIPIFQRRRAQEGAEAWAIPGVSGSGSPPLLGETHAPTFVWKIHNFRNLLSRKGVTSANSSIFYCSGYKWYLAVVPRDREAGSFSPVVSLCLGMNREKLEPVNSVVAVFELSIYNHSDGMYYGYRASSGFDVKHPRSEFKRLIPLNVLKSSDFLHDDCCVLGVEILKIDVFSPENKAIVKAATVQNLFIQQKGLIKEAYNVSIKNFLQQNSKDLILSPTFELCGHKWYLAIYPHGDKYSTGCLSLYMYAADGDLPLDPAVELVLSIVDQKYGVDHFSKSLVYRSKHRWGYSNFCPLSTFKDLSSC